MGKKDIGLKAYLQNTVRYADLWNGAVFQGKQIIKAEELQEITPVHSKADQDAILESRILSILNILGQNCVRFLRCSRDETTKKIL